MLQFPLLLNVELIDEMSESVAVFNAARIVPSASFVPASSVARCSCVMFSASSACPMSSRLLAFTGGGLIIPRRTCVLHICIAHIIYSLSLPINPGTTLFSSARCNSSTYIYTSATTIAIWSYILSILVRHNLLLKVFAHILGNNISEPTRQVNASKSHVHHDKASSRI